MFNSRIHTLYKLMQEGINDIKSQDPSNNIIKIIRDFQKCHQITCLILVECRVDSNTTRSISSVEDKKNKINKKYGNNSNKLEKLEEKEGKILKKDNKPNAYLDKVVFNKGLLRAAMDSQIRKLMKKKTSWEQLYNECKRKLPSNCLFLQIEDKCDEICGETCEKTKLEILEALEILLQPEKAAFYRYVNSSHKLLLKRVRLRITLTNMYLEVLEIISNIILGYKNQIEQERVNQDENEYKREKLELVKNRVSIVSEMGDQFKGVQLICGQIKRTEGMLLANSQQIQDLNNRLEAIEKIIIKLDLAIEFAPHALVVNRSDITRVSAVIRPKEGYEDCFRSYLDELKNFDLARTKNKLASSSISDDQWNEMDKRGETKFILKEDKEYLIKTKDEIAERKNQMEKSDEELKEDLEREKENLFEMCEKYNDYISTSREKLQILDDNNILISPIDISNRNLGELIDEIDEKYNNLSSIKEKYENEIGKYEINIELMEKVKDLWNQINNEWKGYNQSDTHSFADLKKDETKFQDAVNELAKIPDSEEIEVAYREKTVCINDAFAEMARDVISFVDQLKENLNDLCINIQQESIVYEEEFWAELKRYNGIENIKECASMLFAFNSLNITKDACQYPESISVITLKDPEKISADDEFIREFLLRQGYLVEFSFKIKGENAKIISNKKDIRVIDIIKKIATPGNYISVLVEVNPEGMLKEGKKISKLATTTLIKSNTGKYFEKNLEGITNKSNFEDSIFVEYGSDNWKELTGEKKNEIFGHNIGESIGTIFKYHLTEFNRRKEKRINEGGIIILGFEIK